MTTAILPLGADAIASLLQREVKPVFFLGAGASIRSGIPLAGMLVEAIARFAYCKVHNRNPDDPTLMRSDWIRWLEKQTWYRLDVPAASLYPVAVEHLLQPQSNRKEFFQRVLKPDVPASEGYRRLANLLARRMVRTVLTTNFDDLVIRTAKQTPTVRHVEEIFTESDHTLFRTNPPHPQVVYLHGSVNHYTDRNLIAETQELNKNLSNLLQPLLRDHPLVVIGYRGTEPSIMKDLLINRAEQCGRFREGIYWCHLAGSTPVQDSPLVAELGATIGSNLQFVQIDGFDELMTAAERSVQVSATDTWGTGAAAPDEIAPLRVNDLQASSLGLADLNESLLRTKLVEYAAAMRLTTPTLSTNEQLWGAMLAQNLAIATGADRKATKGGQLLFAKSERQQVGAAKVLVTVSGPAGWVDEVLDQPSTRAAGGDAISEAMTLTGDLWSQLDQASNLLSRVNRPFRMKGPVSQTAYPYPPLALKELLTNLLAHRDYQVDRPATLRITREEVRFENPGGLVDSVRGQLEEESIQQVIGGGTRRLKGYRNPVVADFFFSAGAMDKEGSGLPDVVQEAANNLNTVEFGPTLDNATFVAAIRCRPEALHVDQDTKTARPQQGELRYSPNLLRIISWPERVRKVGTIASLKDIARAEAAPSPPFGAHRNWIWTFADLSSAASRALLELGIEEEQHEVSTTELLADRDAGSVLPRLLNTALAAHLTHGGMLVRFEAGRLRAYYPANEGEPREISYKSAFRQSKRTVAKPIVSRTSGKVVYWEHKAVALRFERFGATWALSLLPGYVFTVDGHSQPIASERIGPLSTRRAARDYNPTVLHDLVFWSRMLAAEAETDFAIPLSSEADAPTVRLASMIPTFVFQEAIESGISDASESQMPMDKEFDALQDEIEQAIADSAESAEEQDEVADR
jgi:NAD-dependent SIR2 family protein deacetylase